MHIHHLALRVRDFEKSLHFYVYDPDGLSVQVREYR